METGLELNQGIGFFPEGQKQPELRLGLDG